jgi:hypothetical protein
MFELHLASAAIGFVVGVLVPLAITGVVGTVLFFKE